METEKEKLKWSRFELHCSYCKCINVWTVIIRFVYVPFVYCEECRGEIKVNYFMGKEGDGK